MSVSELAKHIGYSKATAKVYRSVKELIADEVIVYSDPDNHTTRNQKLSLK